METEEEQRGSRGQEERGHDERYCRADGRKPAGTVDDHERVVNAEDEKEKAQESSETRAGKYCVVTGKISSLLRNPRRLSPAQCSEDGGDQAENGIE